MPPAARCDDAPARGGAREAEARSLFEQGNVHYELGEYDRAATHFRQAYELSREPDLLFNLAQAYRLGGACRRALEAYRQFTRLSKEVELVAQAEKHKLHLAESCPAGEAAAQGTVIAPPLTGSADEASRPYLWWSLGTTAAAALTGVAAGGMFLWNNGRFGDWRDEDQRLTAGSRETDDPQSAATRQEANDSLGRSIMRADQVTLGLAVSAAILATGAGVLYWMYDRDTAKATVALAPGGFWGGLTW